MIRIVHFSDIHLSYEHLEDFQNFIMKAIIKDLKKHIKGGKAIDIIAFSGDLIDRGGMSFGNDLEIALDFFNEFVIEPISKELNIPKNRFFFCQGNHDMNRSYDEKFEEKGLSDTLVTTDEINEYMNKKTLKGSKRILKFKEFEKKYYSNYDNKYEISDFNSIFKLELDDYTIGINCINTAWRCYDSEKDKGKLIIGEKQFTNFRSILESCHTTIALMHHHIDWLSDVDKSSTRKFLHKDYKVILCGHVHESENWSKTSTYGNTYISIAPSNWTNNIRTDSIKFSNGYSIIDYDLKSNVIINRLRRYSFEREEYVPNVDLGNDEGILRTELLSHGEITKFQHQLSLAKVIEDKYFEEKNEHLLSHYTNTTAPKTIDDIFVEPIIVKKEDYNADKDDEECIVITEICSNKNSTIIFGMKESGKTILLDKIFFELTKKIEEYKKIPICIDFEQFTHSKLKTAISRFVDISIKEIDNFIQEQDIVILIDNLEFHLSHHRKKMTILQDFIKEYPNVQIIATSSFTLSGKIPIDELIKYDELTNFNILELKNFKTKQIRELMCKWFKDNSNYLNFVQNETK